MRRKDAVHPNDDCLRNAPHCHWYATSSKLQLLKHALRVRDGSFPNGLADVGHLVLILGPEQLPPPQSPEHERENQNPNQNEAPRQHTSQNMQRIALERCAQCECGSDKRRIRKHKTEPRHLEGQPVIGLEVLPQRPCGDEEEPYAQGPEPQTHHVGENFEDKDRVGIAEEVGRYYLLGMIAKADDAGNREGKRTDGDEDTGSLSVPRQLLGHEAVEECGGYHEADEEGGALDGDAGEADRYGVQGADLLRVDRCRDEGAAKRSREEQRIRWENPNWGHCVDRESAVVQTRVRVRVRVGLAEVDLQCRPQDQVDTRADEHTETNIYPEQHLHDTEKPGPRMWNAVFTCCDENRGDTVVLVSGAHTFIHARHAR